MVLDYFDFLVDFTTFKAGDRILITVWKKNRTLVFLVKMQVNKQAFTHIIGADINSGEF